VEHLKGASLRTMKALLANVMLTWKGFILLCTVIDYGCKKFYNIGLWPCPWHAGLG